MKFQHFSICSIRWLDNHHHYYLQKICHRVGWHIFDLEVVNDTLKLSHLPRSMFKKRGVKVSHC